jgi:hypothetical protein
MPMSTLQIFVSEFMAPFFGVTIGIAMVWFAWRASSDGYPPFIGPGSFNELSDFAKDQQRQLLHQASVEAFRGWRSLTPIVIFAAIFAAGAAFGRTLPKITSVPDSFWVHAGFAALFAGFGGWLAGRLEVCYVRPFLKASIGRTHDAA